MSALHQPDARIERRMPCTTTEYERFADTDV